MQKYISIVFLLCITGSTAVFAQQKQQDVLILADTVKGNPINPLAPARAAFLSAIVPGLGQAYNKKYWKIPIVYAALGTGVYFYSDNNTKYHRLRDAYKKRLRGIPDEYLGEYSDATLINGQRTFQRDRDLSLIITIGLYALNIIDANVDAHLMQFNVNNNLSFKPDIYPNEINNKQNVGLTFHYNF